MYEQYIRKRLGCTKPEAVEIARVYEGHSFEELKAGLAFLKRSQAPTPPTAVRLFHPVPTSEMRACPHCQSQLVQWRGSRGLVWVCNPCRRVVG